MNITELKSLALQIKGETTPEANTAIRVGTLFENIIEYLSFVNGWALYVDTQYTEANPFILVHDVKTELPNNGAVSNTTQTPSDIAEMYDSASQLITGRNGDGLAVLIQFKVKPTSNSNQIELTTSVDIGGSLGEVFSKSERINRGNGEVYSSITSFTGFTAETFEANGGKIKVYGTETDLEIYDIQYILTRTHKATF